MNTTVNYGGYSTQPSDYECPDGALSLSLNLINENGTIAPILPPQLVRGYGAVTPVYIHKVNSGSITILRNSSLSEINMLYSVDGEEQSPVQLVNYTPDASTDGYVEQVSSLGNILMILTRSGIDHFIWDSETHKYKPLGNAIPEISLSFGLRGNVEYTEEYSTGINSVLVKDMYNEWVDETKEVITSAVLAKVNKFIADNATNKGRFIFPFFVRYALRLFDGSLINHSAPILMHAATGETPNVLVNSLDKQDGSDNHYEKMRYRVAAVCHDLDFQVIGSGQSLEQLKTTWADIVKSVDIFVSAPIYTFDPNGKCEIFIEDDVTDLRSTCRAMDYEPGLNAGIYKEYEVFSMYRNVFYNKIHDDMKPHFNRRCQLPLLSDSSSVPDKIKNNAQFYLLKSINIEELTEERTMIDIPEDYLGSLVTREAMTDDYDSHDVLIARTAFDYNSRINIANVKKYIFPGFPIKSAACYNNAANYSYRVLFFIKDDGRTITADIPYSTFGDLDSRLYLYHPSPNAFKAVIYRKNSSETLMLECPMKQHDFLAGSYYYNEGGSLPWQRVPAGSPEIEASPASELMVYARNKIYTSAVNNPFVFPVTSITTVGSGEILALSTAAKALSQGQFGQFPLYVFTTEGVWALEVSATGVYSARQPVSRDVCINAEAITQIDSGVIFPTDRGLMLIAGSQTECISDAINSIVPHSLLNLPRFGENLLFKFSQTAPESDRFMPLPPLGSLLKTCRMAYDYSNQRIWLLFPTRPYCYVLSLKSRLWAMQYTNYTSALNSYPDCYVVAPENYVFNLSCMPDAAATVQGLIVTRPLKLGGADIHKTIDNVIQRGNFRKGHVQSVLYGSRDLMTWHLVWSSKDHFMRGFRGTPYKYFRIALLCSMSADESIYGASIQFTPRLTNQPR
ncbi:MAG: hypothetical protein HDS77_06900 [Bacteroidales bacterium]|nr:hypothetical protein [Bacteroidales bacterium]